MADLNNYLALVDSTQTASRFTTNFRRISKYDSNSPIGLLDESTDPGTQFSAIPVTVFDPTYAVLAVVVGLGNPGDWWYDYLAGREHGKIFTTVGTNYFYVPPGVTNISVVCVGGGGGGTGYNGGSGGGGGGLAYANNIPVKPGQEIKVTVGAGGASAPYAASGTAAGDGGDSYIEIEGSIRCHAGGGSGAPNSSSGGSGGTAIVGTGGAGGDGGSKGGSGGGGGGGAGGYTGNGGNGSASTSSSSASTNGQNGSGGGGGGGAGGSVTAGGGGGGVGLYGNLSNGAGGAAAVAGGGGGGGSGGSYINTPDQQVGTDGGNGTGQNQDNGGRGGDYGGGGAGSRLGGCTGEQGAIRIVYNINGVTRAFPSTNVSSDGYQRGDLDNTGGAMGTLDLSDQLEFQKVAAGTASSTVLARYDERFQMDNTITGPIRSLKEADYFVAAGAAATFEFTSLARSGQYNTTSYEQMTANATERAALAGQTGYIVWVHYGNTSFYGDVQIDDINVDGTSYNSSGTFTSLQRPNSASRFPNPGTWDFQTEYTSVDQTVGWTGLTTGTSTFRWNIDAGGTGSSSTGLTFDGPISTDGYYIYSEASSTSNSVFWVRTPLTTFSASPQFEYYQARYGSTIGNVECWFVDQYGFGIPAQSSLPGPEVVGKDVYKLGVTAYGSDTAWGKVAMKCDWNGSQCSYVTWACPADSSGVNSDLITALGNCTVGETWTFHFEEDFLGQNSTQTSTPNHILGAFKGEVIENTVGQANGRLRVQVSTSANSVGGYFALAHPNGTSTWIASPAGIPYSSTMQYSNGSDFGIPAKVLPSGPYPPGYTPPYSYPTYTFSSTTLTYYSNPTSLSGQGGIYVGGPNGDDYVYNLGGTSSASSTAIERWDLPNLTNKITQTGIPLSPPGGYSRAIAFNASGSIMFIAGNNGIIHEYTLGTAWDPRTMTATGASYQSITFGTSADDTETMQFTSDGSYFIQCGYGTPGPKLYSLSTPWDMTTATLVSENNLSTAFTGATSGQIADITGSISIYMNDAGTQTIVFDQDTFYLNYYSHDAYQLNSNLTFVGRRFVPNTSTNPRSATLSPNVITDTLGPRLWLHDNSGGLKIYTGV